MRPVLALDIGGTKLAAGMVDADGEVRGRLEVPTRPEDGAELVFERAVDLAARVREEQAAGERVTALGVSTKGLTARRRCADIRHAGMVGPPDPAPPAGAVP